jgi:hypothetical protein
LVGKPLVVPVQHCAEEGLCKGEVQQPHIAEEAPADEADPFGEITAWDEVLVDADVAGLEREDWQRGWVQGIERGAFEVERQSKRTPSHFMCTRTGRGRSASST